MTQVASMPLPDEVSCPKLPRHSTRYRYYPGFSRAFVIDVLSGLPEGTRVLDPWNGSGTTTRVASELGLVSLGVDLNPAMVVLARAALLTPRDVDEIAEQANMLAELRVMRLAPADDDPLLEWFDKPSVAKFRALQHVLAGANRFTETDVSGLDTVKCFWLSAFFVLLREATRAWQASNPTWIKSRHGAPAAKLYWGKMTGTLRKLSEQAEAVSEDRHVEGEVVCGTSMDLASHDFTPDLVLGSPPYCTRLDYGIATRIELSVLGLSANEQSALRRILLGTTTVPASAPSAASLGLAAIRLLDGVKAHESKASATYYWKWLAQYLVGYASSLVEIARTASLTGTIGLVVQDSFYKDIHIDLAALTEEALQSQGWCLERSYAFRSRRSMAHINPRAEAYRNGHTPQESALFFRRS